jgi:hypothetical protein
MSRFRMFSIGFPKKFGGSEQAMTLIELLIATALGGFVLYAAIMIMSNLKNSSLNSERRQTALTETSELLNSIKEAWDARQKPAGYTSNFTAAEKGFTLRNPGGAPCSTNCSRLDIPVPRANGIVDTVTVQSSCLNYGAINGQFILSKLNFNAALTGGGCTRCGAGTIPIVTISQTIPKLTRRYPHNGEVSMNTFAINGLIGFNSCFTQTGTQPLKIVVTAVALPDNEGGSTLSLDNGSLEALHLKAFSRSLMLPFNNFANVRVNSNN